MPRPPSSVTGRELVARLAAHIAFLMNDGADRVVEVKPFALFQHLIALLSGRGPLGAAYRDGLLAYRLAAADRSEEEVAQAYIDRVLDRGFMLARADHQHIAHRLLASSAAVARRMAGRLRNCPATRPAKRPAATGPTISAS